MAEFLAMGGYGGYVWTSYAVFGLVLLLDAVTPLLQRRRALRDLRSRLKRQARNVSNRSRPPGAEGAA
jgi:heme exporter protein D